MSSTERSAENGPPREQDTGDLLGGLLADAKDLVVAHGERMKLEVRGELASLKDTMKLVGFAVGAVVLAGVLAAQAIALGLAAAFGLPTWAGYAIIAAIAAVGGYLMYKRRPASHHIDLVPEDAINGVKRDAQRVSDAVS
jgi:hypothetical protein